MRRRLLDHTYKKTVTGNPAVAKSVARMYPDISFPGFTTQDGTPSPENPVDIVNAQSPVQVEVMGTNLFDLSYALNPSNYNDIYISGIKYNALVYHVKPNTDYILSVEWKKEKPSVNLCIANDEKRSSLFTEGYMSISVNSLDNGIIYVLYTGRLLDDNISELTLNYDGIMLAEGNAKIPYEPYKQPQTVTITSERPITKWDKLIKQDGVWGWLYKSENIVFDGSTDEEWRDNPAIGENGFSIFYMNSRYNTILCDKLLGFYSGNFASMPYNHIKEQSNIIGIKIQGINTISDLREWMSESKLNIWHEISSAEFTPLPQEQQDMLNALHTNNPTTVVQNSIGTDVTLTYKTKRSLEVTQ